MAPDLETIYKSGKSICANQLLDTSELTL